MDVCLAASSARERTRVGLRARVLGAMLACVSAAAHPSASPVTEPHWVTFHSARAVPSDLARRALGSAVDSARPREALRGLLVVPDGDGPFPAVVLVHGCRGVLSSQRGWARWFARHGFVALLVDSFFTRRSSGVCSLGPWAGARQEVSGRVFDAFGALEFLHGDPRVNPERVAIMGWNTWIPMSAVSRGGPRALAAAGFSAAVAVSPDCPLDADRPGVPVLVLVGANDPLHAARNCEWLAGHSEGTIQVAVLEGAGHGFDDVGANESGGSMTVFHLASASQRQIPVRYDRAAHEAATRQVLAFLVPRLAARDPDRVPAVQDELPPGAHWAVDPSRPGPDRPSAGRSLFDRVFADAGGQVRIPFPFSRVLDHLEAELGAAEAGGEGASQHVRRGLAVSLIPLGRSLQRGAAAPDFFRYPRVVVAVDGEPATRPARFWLKDRLFLGYQEKARMIEVISWNASLGRFEFQVVDGYAEGAVPRVRYANRRVCVSCHQNGAPIFPRAGWDETSSNAAIARRLREAGGGFHRLTGRTGAEAAARVDNATDRANLLAVWQRAWRDGCGASDDAGRACRGAALVAMVQDRLSGSSGHDRASHRYRRAFHARLSRRWARLWPGGLAVPDPDLVNREPLLDPTPTEIGARDDPLSPRPPAAVWRGETDAWRLVPGLAQSLAQVDLAAVDDHLRQRARQQDAARRAIATACRASQRGLRTGRHRVILACRGRSEDTDLAPDFEMTMDFQGRSVLAGNARYLDLGDGVLLERVRAAPLAGPEGLLSLELRQGQSGLSVRTLRGDAVERIDVSRERMAQALASGAAVDALAVVWVIADFQPLVDAVDAMVGDRAAEALDGRVFEPLALMGEVSRRLGVPHPRRCCEHPVTSPLLVAGPDDDGVPAVLPSPEAASSRGDPIAADAVIAAFNRRCGSCHRARTLVPPGFLHGSGPTVRETLSHCAPRIARRLSMWQRAPAQRSHSPMPPPAVLASLGLDEESWLASDDYRALLGWARSRAGDADPLRLPGCLPTASVSVRR